MHFWRAGFFKASADFADAIRGDDSLAKLVRYLDFRGRGLRRQAMAALDEFVVDARDWPTERQRAFADGVLSAIEGNPDLHDLKAEPLQRGFVTPVIRAWREAEPRNPVPWRWGDDVDLIRRAVDLDPTDQIARRRLIRRLMGCVAHAAHELPAGYIGDPTSDLADIAEVELLATGLRDPGLERGAADFVRMHRPVIDAYQLFRAQGSPGAFREWAIAQGRPFRA